MTVKAILAILTALSGCYSYLSLTDYPGCYKNTSEHSFNLKCTDSKSRVIDVYTIDHTLYITHKNGPIIVELEKFPKEYFQSINQEIRGVIIENCTVPDGYSFGILFDYFGIKTFKGVSIGPSLDGRFSGGFGKVDFLTLSGNKISQLNETVFQSLTALSGLYLSSNEITTIHKNVFVNLQELTELKLNENQLESLPEGVFKNQKQLEVLLLDRNRLQKLTMQMFQGLDSLKILSMEKNQLLSLTDDVFHNIPRLLQISLGNDNIRIPFTIFAKQTQLEYVFLEEVKVDEGLNLSDLKMLQIKWSEVMTISGLSNITEVAIIKGTLHPLDVTSFKSLSGMKVLNLTSNEIANLQDGLFDGLKELIQLDLSKNLLTNISGLLFRDLQNLTKIDLSDNRLTTIDSNAFIYTTKLETINLKNNRLSFGDNQLPFTHLYNLRILNLNNNSLTRFPSDLAKLWKLKEMDLGFNQISSVKFCEIRQNFVNLTSTYETRSALGNSTTRTFLNNNPLACDCGIFEFLQRTDLEHLAEIFSHNCPNDAYYLEPCHRETYTGAKCPAKCSCAERKDKSGVHILISCKGKELTTVPEIEFLHATSIELDLSNNRLTELPKLQTNLNITFIQASFNQISEIALENIPPNLRGLDLSHNNVKTIAANVIHRIKNLRSLEIFFLKDNPLACHCNSADTVELIEFVKENNSITDLQGAKCNAHDELSTEILEENCRTKFIIYSLVFATILTLITGILSVLIIQHHEFIKMWLYAHDWFLWWVDEEYVDRDKVYDVFISYAAENRDLALYLVQVFEGRSLSFKFCLHERDFLGGERIEQSVIDAVKNSRRTMVILSENYLQSQWCTHEFHLALERSLSEKRKIIIAVKYGDLGNVADADATIESYIKTHTYIESSDKWFWERVLYALPHRKQKKKNALQIKGKEIENIP